MPKTANPEVTSVDPMHVEANAPVQLTKTPKTLETRPCSHRLIRRPWTQASVQPVLSKTESIGVFQPATFGKLDNWEVKSSPKVLKSWGDKDDDFKNPSPKDLHEIPHGLRGIEGNRNKSGVFSRNAKRSRTSILTSSWFPEVLH